MSQIESEAWFDESTDIVYVKVRLWEPTPDNPYAKRGVIFKMTSEYLATLPSIAEGQAYPHKSAEGLIPVDTDSYPQMGASCPSESSKTTVCNDGRDVSVCCKAPTKAVFGDMRVCTKCGK